MRLNNQLINYPGILIVLTYCFILYFLQDVLEPFPYVFMNEFDWPMTSATTGV